MLSCGAFFVGRLSIWSNGKAVGVITQDAAGRRLSLEYAPEWLRSRGIPLSPRLDPAALARDHSDELEAFLENLLPEGQALADAAALYGLSKYDTFGLIRALGTETSGALTFLPESALPDNAAAPSRWIALTELSERVRAREQLPFAIWDGAIRPAIAGYQDKLAAYRAPDGQLYIAEDVRASTHIIKPAPRNPMIAHLVHNEAFCMRLARAVGLPVADVELLRVPEPVLLVERFDRRLGPDGSVERIHVIDGCQALGLPPGHKYERIFGAGADVAHIRDGASLPRLVDLLESSADPDAQRLELLRWVLFQYLIGNTDAHAKNLSCFATPEGLALTPTYDLVCVEVHSCFDQSIALAIGDVFHFSAVRAYDWAEFGAVCRIPRDLLVGEMASIAHAVLTAAPAVASIECADPAEVEYLESLVTFVSARAQQLARDAELVLDVPDDLLSVRSARS